VVVAFLTLRVFGLEEEVAASRLEAEDLRCRLNDLEGRHEALARVALDAVRVVRPEGQLLPDRFRSLPHQVRGAVALGVFQGAATSWPRRGFGPAGTQVPGGDQPPGAEGARHCVCWSRCCHCYGGRRR
jgi:hypothetical protein